MDVLSSLIQKAEKEGKPPVKKEIMKLKEKYSVLSELPWIKIKHQIWAKAQTLIVKKKKVVDIFLDN